jgi:uncharacterized SAM-binding protein YcdF (DUF218 family)
LFFILSKTIGIMLLPANFLIGVGLVGMLLLLTRFASLGRKLMVASLLLLIVCAFSPFGNWVLYPLETRFPPWDVSRGAPDGIVVLGGPIDPDLSAIHGVPVIGAGADRLIAATSLARQYPKARLLYTGGSATLISGDGREADYALQVFESLGLPKERVEIERRARNTWENAEFAKIIAAPKPGERWLMVTSAYHMPRAVGVFRQAGFAVEPYPVDWRVGDRSDLWTFRKYAIDGLSTVEVSVREWMGLVAYRLSGKSSALFPAPE